MEADHHRLFGRRHVVELVTGGLRDVGIDIVGHMPVRIAQEEFGNVGDVGLDQDFRIARGDRERGVSGRVAGASIEVMPGATSLPHSYFVTLDSMPA